MTNTVYIKAYDEPPFNTKEILRYAGVRGEAPELDGLIKDCIGEVSGKLAYKVCWREFEISAENDCVDLGFAKVSSAAPRKNLDGCGSILLFAATLGIQLDRLIARYSALSPSKALMLQAVGAERIESLCDAFNREITELKAAEGLATRPRFSPGYGDFGLEMQRDIFRVLDCPRKIGLSLNDSLLMSPSKSVTALIGITNKTGAAK